MLTMASYACEHHSYSVTCYDGLPSRLTASVAQADRLKILNSRVTQTAWTNTAGTRGGLGGRDRTSAVKRRKNAENLFFFS